MSTNLADYPHIQLYLAQNPNCRLAKLNLVHYARNGEEVKQLWMGIVDEEDNTMIAAGHELGVVMPGEYTALLWLNSILGI